LGGTGGLSISGSGAVALSGANTYTGGTTLSGATLELTAGATAGTGAITFGSQPATLQLDAPVTGTQTFPNTLTGLISGDQIDVQGVPFVAGALRSQFRRRATSSRSRAQAARRRPSRSTRSRSASLPLAMVTAGRCSRQQSIPAPA